MSRDDDAPVPLAHPTDLRLAERAARREPAALEEFARRMTCVPRMVSALNRKMSARLSPDEVDDLAQDVIVLVWRKIGTYGGRATLESWVHRFAFFEIRNVLRRRDRQREVGTEQLEAIPEEKSETLSTDAYAFLARSLDDLKVSAAEVIRLKHFEHLTFDEVGQRLGMPANTAKTLYYRALKELRAKLGPLEGEFS